MSKRIVEKKALKVEMIDGKLLFKHATEILAKEVRVEIYVNNKVHGIYTISDNMVNEFIYGNLLTSNIISSPENVEDIKKFNHKIYVTIKNKRTKSIAKCSSTLSISGVKLIGAMRKFHEKALEFKVTGAFHSAALLDGNTLDFIVYIEDLSRYGAIDKVIGWALLNDIKLCRNILLTSGRVFKETIAKAAAAGIPMIVSKAAPTYNAVCLAEEKKITLIGFMRKHRFNVYACPHRILEYSKNIV